MKNSHNKKDIDEDENSDVGGNCRGSKKHSYDKIDDESFSNYEIENRKLDHIEVCKNFDVEGYNNTGFCDITLLHNAIPEIDKKEIDTSTNFLGKNLEFPFVIPAMTGGHPDVTYLNRRLAKSAEEMGIGIGVGSQRATLENKSDEIVQSLSVVAEEAPTALKIANLGAPQVSSDYSIKEALNSIEMIEADAIAVHLNYLQEAIQMEGDTDAEGTLLAISNLSKNLDVPLMVKETGAGISRGVARALRDAGVAAIDVSGKGGTNWALVEKIRSRNKGVEIKEKLGSTFSKWGIPTACSIIESNDLGVQIMASGGLRSGLDIAKSVAIGANCGGAALPLLHSATESMDALVKTIETFKEEFKIAMFLTGSRNISELSSAPVVFGGRVREWKEDREI